MKIEELTSLFGEGYNLTDFDQYISPEDGVTSSVNARSEQMDTGVKPINIDGLKVSRHIKQVILEGLPAYEKHKRLRNEIRRELKDITGETLLRKLSRSEADFAVIVALVKAGYDDATIKCVFAKYAIGEKYRQKGNQGDRYLAHSLDKARELTKRHGIDLSKVVPNVTVLGQHEGETLLYAKDTRRIHRVKELSNIDIVRFAEIAGDDVNNIAARNEDNTSKPSLLEVKITIALQARKKIYSHESLIGQGIWPTKSGLFVINGGRTFLIESPHTGNELTEPSSGGFLFDLSESKAWLDTDTLLGKVKEMTPERVKEIHDVVESLVKKWRFKDPRDAVILTGCIFATAVQAIWLWRPHIWILGGADSGKTAFLEFMQELFSPNVLFRNGDITEAGLRQSIANDLKVVLLDEFEKNKHREQILHLLRNSSRGIATTRGQVNHKAIDFLLKQMVWVASIEKGLRWMADITRFIVIELSPIPDGERCTPIAFSSDQVNDLRHDVFAASIFASELAKQRADKLKNVIVPGVLGRLVECYAVPIAMISVLKGMSDNEAQIFLQETIQGHPVLIAYGPGNDWQVLIDEISMLEIKVASQQVDKTMYVTKTVAQILQEEGNNELEQLEAYGIRKLDDQQAFIVPTKIEKHMKEGMFADLNLRDLLLRVPGSKSDRQRIAGKNIRGVAVSLDLLREIKEETEEDDDSSCINYE